MTDDLSSIGFYTLDDMRAKTASHRTSLHRCELILTYKCNFKCAYCRGMLDDDKVELTLDEAKRIVKIWADDGLRNIRFSGGEPTVWPWLVELVSFTNKQGIERIALSTNGSADVELYDALIEAGVNDFSISLDACCSSKAKMMSGIDDLRWEKLVSNIQHISGQTYVTVGVVLTDDNIADVNDIIVYASKTLLVNDIRIITAAQDNKFVSDLVVEDSILNKHPILKYRYNNIKKGRHVRGIHPSDTNKCPLVLDDMAVMNNKHYPCIIYMREHGSAIGTMDPKYREARKEWFERHDCMTDSICRKNCLDVCIDYNNKWAVFHQEDKKLDK